MALSATAAAIFDGVALNRARLEVRRAIAGVNHFYADPQEGLGRAGGLYAGGSLNAQPILDFVLDAYVPARARGRSVAAAAEAMNTAIRSTDDYRAVHPNQANR